MQGARCPLPYRTTDANLATTCAEISKAGADVIQCYGHTMDSMNADFGATLSLLEPSARTV